MTRNSGVTEESTSHLQQLFISNITAPVTSRRKKKRNRDECESNSRKSTRHSPGTKGPVCRGGSRRSSLLRGDKFHPDVIKYGLCETACRCVYVCLCSVRVHERCKKGLSSIACSMAKPDLFGKKNTPQASFGTSLLMNSANVPSGNQSQLMQWHCLCPRALPPKHA